MISSGGLAAVLVFAFVWVISPGPRHIYACRWPESKVDIATLTVVKYANEAFPQWAVSHPDRACPRSLHDLDEYVDRGIQSDPWGRAYQFTCGDGRLYVMSLGEDGRSNTADDIWSHQR